MVLSLLLLRRLSSYKPIKPFLFTLSQTKPFTSDSTPTPTTPSKPTSLSARMSFVFDQIDAIEKERAEKDQTLLRIRAWRESKKAHQAQNQESPDFVSSPDVGSSEMELESRKNDGFGGGLMSKEVELVHPWPEWIELMERLVQQNYFDHKRKDEDKMIEDLGFNVAEVVEDEGFDFTRDWKTVQTAVLNFGRDRFDILRCDFMNFAKNTVCLQCDANRPKRQLLPGEWECPQCNFLNYRRNVVCFHCECKRPADDYMPSQQQERQHGPRMQTDKISRRQDVSNAWNFDFDDDESDGADVATFEYADSQKLDEDFPLDRQEQRDTSRGHEDGFYNKSSRTPKGYETEYPAPGKPGLGFNDFDDEEDDVDSYELDRNGTHRSSRIDFSDIEVNSESEDIDNADDTLHVGRRNSSLASEAHFRPRHQKGAFRGSVDAEVDFDTDDDLPIQTKMKSRQDSNSKPRSRNKGGATSFDSEDDFGLSSDDDDKDFIRQQNKGNKWGSRKDSGRRSSPYSEDEPFSDMESNDGRSFHKTKQRGNKPGQNGRWDLSEGRGARTRDRSSLKDNFKRTSRDSRGSSRGSQDNGYNRSRGHERSSYKPQRGRNSNYGDQSDSYLDDERHRRPRINVR